MSREILNRYLMFGNFFIKIMEHFYSESLHVDNLKLKVVCSTLLKY